MRDPDCVAFLQWALPQMGLRWPGFRKVRRQVCRRITRRLHQLGFVDFTHYRVHLKAHPDEWAHLAFTYFDKHRQRTAAHRFHTALRPGGFLVLGKHETLPQSTPGFEPTEPHIRIYRAINN